RFGGGGRAGSPDRAHARLSGGAPRPRTSPSAETVAGLEQVAAPAQGLVLDLAVDRDLVALEDERPAHLAAVEDRLLPAPADRLELLEAVGDLQQPGGAGEGARAEVGA